MIIGGVSEELSMQCLADDLREEVQEHITDLQDQVDAGELDIEDLVTKLQRNLQIKGKFIIRAIISYHYYLFHPYFIYLFCA